MSSQMSVQQLLDLVQSRMSTVPKASLSATLTTTEHNVEQPQYSTMSVTTIDCDVDRTNRVAHLVVKESHDHARHISEIYYVDDTQYVNSEDGWRASPLSTDQAELMFGGLGGMAQGGIGALRSRAFSVKADDDALTITVASSISSDEVAGTVPPGSRPKDTAAISYGEGEVEVDVNRHDLTISGFRVNASGEHEGVASKQTVNVVVNPLADSYTITLPADVRQARAQISAGPQVHGAQMLTLARAATSGACWCTGCAACTACLACMACISCVACLFPPLLAPVTAAAAGTAIAAAISTATSVSVGVATAIQKGK